MTKLEIQNIYAFMQYLSDYINEEISRGATIDKYTISDAIDAYLGGANDA